MSSNIRHRVTSAPYRFAEQTPSQYHAKCSNAKPITTSFGEKSPALANIDYQEFQKNSTVVQDEIWKHSCWKEATRETKWEQTWGFLKDYDPKGNVKERKEYCDTESTVYSDNVPNTSNGNYGQRLQSPTTHLINRLEQTPHKLKKNEEILYCE